MKQTITKGKFFDGKVVSTKMKDTVVVEVMHITHHPLYRKAMKRTNNLFAHCTDPKIVDGMQVRIKEVRPISKMKRYIVVNEKA